MSTTIKSLKIKITADNKQLKSSLSETERKLSETGKKFNSFGKSIGKLAFAGGGIFLLQKTIRAVTKTVADFEKEFANVTTLLDISGKATLKMRNDVLSLAGELGSATELTKGLYQALSAGVAPAEAVKFVGEAAKFAKAGLTDMFTSVDVLTTVINAYGKEAKDVTHISDVLFQVIKDGKTTGEQLAGSLGRVIPTAATMGVKLEEVGAALAVMTKSGLKTDEAVIALNQTLVSLLKPGKEALETAKSLGIEFSRAGIEGAGGLQKWLQILKEKVGDNKEAFAQLFPNIRALKGVLNLAGNGAKEYSEQMTRMFSVAENTEEAFKKQKETLVASFDAIKNKVSSVIIEELTPSFKELAKTLRDPETIKSMKELIKVFVTLTKFVLDSVLAISKFLRSIQEAVRFSKLNAKETDKVMKANQEQTKTYIQLRNELEKSGAAFRDIREAMRDFERQGKTQLERLQSVVSAVKNGSKAYPKLTSAVDALGDNFDEATPKIKKSEVVLKNTTVGVKKYAEAIKLDSKLLKILSGDQLAINKEFEKGAPKVEKVKDEVEDLSGALKIFNRDTQSANDKIGDLGRNFEDFFEDLLKGIGIFNAVIDACAKLGIVSDSTARSLTEFAGGIGDVIAGVTSGDVVGVIGGVAKVIKSLDELLFDRTSGEEWAKMIEDATDAGLEELIRQVENGEGKFKNLSKALRSALIEMLKVEQSTRAFEELNEVLKNFDTLLSEGAAAYEEVIKNTELFGDLSVKAYEAILAYQKKVADNQELVDSIENFNKAFLNIAEIAGVNQASFDLLKEDIEAFSGKTKDAFDELIKKGFTSDEALKMLAPTLAKLKQFADEFGLELSDDVKKLIEMGDQKGLLDDLNDPQKMMVKLLEEIAILLGKEIPNAFGNAAKSAKNFGNQAKNAFEKIPKTFGEGGNMPVFDFGKPRTGFSNGVDQIMSSDQNVRVHAGERLRVEPNSGAMSGGDTFNVNVNVAGGTSNNNIARQIIREIDNNRSGLTKSVYDGSRRFDREAPTRG